MFTSVTLFVLPWATFPGDRKHVVPYSRSRPWLLGLHTRTHARTHIRVPSQPLFLVLPSLLQCPPFQNPGVNPPTVLTNTIPRLLSIPQLLTEHENAAEHALF